MGAYSLIVNSSLLLFCTPSASSSKAKARSKCAVLFKQPIYRNRFWISQTVTWSGVLRSGRMVAMAKKTLRSLLYNDYLEHLGMYIPVIYGHSDCKQATLTCPWLFEFQQTRPAHTPITLYQSPCCHLDLHHRRRICMADSCDKAAFLLPCHPRFIFLSLSY